MNEKRTLEEIIAQYALEPGLKDIFVEGHSDKCVIDWYLDAKGIGGISVYPIDLIDIPNDVLQSHGLPLHSNRSKILALAYELSKRFSQGLRVFCLADRDFEDYCASVSPNPYLLLTDCNSMELYAFTSKTMHKFVTVALGGLPLCTSKLVEGIISILQHIYAYRLSNELLGWSMEWIPFTKYAEVNRGVIGFDNKRFEKAYLEKNGRWQEQSIFLNKVLEVSRSLSRDPGRKIRGHDLGELLLLIVKKMRRDRKFGNAETIEGCLLAAVECQDLDNTSLFQRISQLAL